MGKRNYTVVNGNLEVKAGNRAIIFLNKDVEYESITVDKGASLQFIGDYHICVIGDIIYNKINMFPYPDNPDLHVVEFSG